MIQVLLFNKASIRTLYKKSCKEISLELRISLISEVFLKFSVL